MRQHCSCGCTSWDGVDVVCRWRWSRRKRCCLVPQICCWRWAWWEASSSLRSEALWVSTSIPVSAYPAIYSTTHSFLQQVVLECSLDFCFTYIFQYEPYMKDNVGFPKVTVSLMHTWVQLTCCEMHYTLRCWKHEDWHRWWYHWDGNMMDWRISCLVDAGVLLLCFAAPGGVCLWASRSGMHMDVGLDSGPRRSCSSGTYSKHYNYCQLKSFSFIQINLI